VELQEIVKKYLPAEKIKASVQTENKKTKEEQLRHKAIITFVKENRSTAEKIKSALSDGDTKTAHRIAHTLKSNAAYLGKTELQKAAASLEDSLNGEPPVFTPEQIEKIETELESALCEFEKITETEKSEVAQISAEELSALFAELKPLLENSDFSSADYVQKLQGVSGMAELAERIDEYDFDAALKILKGVMDNE
jgi:HPt (histidine-containing phosphotransfer) domain-containing protein